MEVRAIQAGGPITARARGEEARVGNHQEFTGLPRRLSGKKKKNPPANAGDAGDAGSISVGKIPEGRDGNPL